MENVPSSPTRLKIQVVVSRPFMENTYIVQIADRNDCIVVDPGFEPNVITEFLTRNRLTLAAILNTHGHADHIAGNETLKRCWPACPLVIGAKEAFKLSDAEANLSLKYGFSIISPPADVLVHENEVFSAAGIDLEVRETPGHSLGHVVFVWKAGDPWIVIGGDVLFQGSVGRTDLSDGNFEQLNEAIQSKLFTLPDDTIVLPGHGEPTTIGIEKKTNPFVGMNAGLNH